MMFWSPCYVYLIRLFPTSPRRVFVTKFTERTMLGLCTYLKGLVFITASLATASLTLFTSSHLNALHYNPSALTWLLGFMGLALAPASFLHIICQKQISKWRPKFSSKAFKTLWTMCVFSKPSTATKVWQPDDEEEDSRAMEESKPLWGKVVFWMSLVSLLIMIGLEMGSLVFLVQGQLSLVRSFVILPAFDNASGSSCFCQAGNISLHVDNPSGCHFIINGHFCMANYHGGTLESDKVEGNPPCQMSSAIGSQSLNRECLLYRLFERMVWALGILISVVILCQVYLVLHWTCRPSLTCTKFKSPDDNPIEPETLTNRNSSLDRSKFATITSRQQSRSALASLTSLPGDFFPAKEEIELSENPLTFRGKEDHDQEVFLISPNSKIVPIKQSQTLHRPSSGRRMTLAELPGHETPRDARKLRRLSSFGHGGLFDEDLKNDIGNDTLISTRGFQPLFNSSVVAGGTGHQIIISSNEQFWASSTNDLLLPLSRLWNWRFDLDLLLWRVWIRLTMFSSLVIIFHWRWRLQMLQDPLMRLISKHSAREQVSFYFERTKIWAISGEPQINLCPFNY